MGEASGQINLPSGTWKWTARLEAHGGLVLLYQEQNPRNRMYARLPANDATPAAIRAAAEEPLVRWWQDRTGETWEVRISTRPQQAMLDRRARSRSRISFHRSGLERSTEFPEGLKLGTITDGHLSALLVLTAVDPSPRSAN